MYSSIWIRTWESLPRAAQQSSAISQMLRLCLSQLNNSQSKRQRKERTGQEISRDTYVYILITKLCKAGIHHRISCTSTSWFFFSILCATGLDFETGGILALPTCRTVCSFMLQANRLQLFHLKISHFQQLISPENMQGGWKLNSWEQRLDDPLPHLWCPANAILQDLSLYHFFWWRPQPDWHRRRRQQEGEESTQKRLRFHDEGGCAGLNDVSVHSLLISSSIYINGPASRRELSYKSWNISRFTRSFSQAQMREVQWWSLIVTTAVIDMWKML